MSRIKPRVSPFSDRGQSMIETALLLPFLFLLAFNAINFGYFFFVAINLAAAPRSGVEYSIQGSATPAQLTLPLAGPPTCATTSLFVSDLVYNDMARVLPTLQTPSCPNIASVQVCTQTIGLNNRGTTTQTTQCQKWGPAAFFPSPQSDPESPFFILNRVDVIYSFKPLISGVGAFGLTLLPNCSGSPITCQFHRQVSMRIMGP